MPDALAKPHRTACGRNQQLFPQSLLFTLALCYNDPRMASATHSHHLKTRPSRAAQLALFANQGATGDVSGRVEQNHVPVKESTFLGGLASRVHRWFRLTPSFGPDLVWKALRDMDTPPSSLVLDPFAGAGTTLIEAKLEGHSALGFELNPLLYFVSQTSLEWDLDTARLRAGVSRISEEMDRQRSTLGSRPLESLAHLVPPIHNVYRWWRPDVLADLILLLQSVRKTEQAPKYAHFFELAIAGILVPDLTNVTLGRLQLHFIDRQRDDIRVWATFEAHVQKMIEDLDAVHEQGPVGNARILCTDATDPDVPYAPLVDRVVTSPPYPNRYSYVWNTRPHLYLLGMFNTAKQASDLDMKTIGGTWGTATSILSKGRLEPDFPVIAREILPVSDDIRKADNLMANYVTKYFNNLGRHIVAQDRLLRQGARLAYVVGCSRIKGVYVETDVLLGKLFEGLGLGYSVLRIERFRRRHSGKDLHESTVYVRKAANRTTSSTAGPSVSRP